MMLKKLLSWLALLGAVAAFVAFVAIGGGVWAVRGEVDRRAGLLLHEATAALDRAQPAARLVRETLDGAETELQSAQRPTAPAPAMPAVPKMLLRSALKQTPEKVETAARAVDAIGSLLIVANVALDAAEESPGVVPVSADELTALRQKLAASAGTLHQAEALLRPAAGDAVSADDLHRIENAIRQGRSVVGDVEGKLGAVRGQVDAFREHYPAMIRTATWGIFV